MKRLVNFILLTVILFALLMMGGCRGSSTAASATTSVTTVEAVVAAYADSAESHDVQHVAVCDSVRTSSVTEAVLEIERDTAGRPRLYVFRSYNLRRGWSAAAANTMERHKAVTAVSKADSVTNQSTQTEERRQRSAAAGPPWWFPPLLIFVIVFGFIYVRWELSRP